MLIRYNFNNPLPEPYEKQMPVGLDDTYQQFLWRQRKLNDLILQNLAFVDTDGNVTFSDAISIPDEQITDTVVSNSEEADNNNVDSKSEDEIETVVYEQLIESSKNTVMKHKTKSTSNQNKNDIENIKYVPVSVMESVRKIFPVSASKADLISAVVYLFTDGDCNISEKAMELVKMYEKNDAMLSISERLTRLENTNRRQLEMLQSIELCTCFNTFDRRYGSNMPRKGAKNTEFRETDNLDMLARLRTQAMDQLHADEKERGRQIYNSTKDLHD